MEHCKEKPPVGPREDDSNDNPCLRIKGHGDGLHIMYDRYSQKFSTWERDYDCKCAEEDCETCIKGEPLSLEGLLVWLDRDFHGKIPKEVTSLINKYKENLVI